MNNERELLTVISYLERERGIGREAIVQAIEAALQLAAKKSMVVTEALRVEIDRKTYKIRAFDTVTVSETETGPGFISLRKAREANPEAQPGDTFEISVPTERLGRIAAQSARQMIVQKIRQVERDNVFEEYKERVGDIIIGIVRSINHRDVYVDLGKTEALLPAKERIPSEDYQVGDRVRAYIHKVVTNPNGPSIMLSRACPEFIKALFRLEVSEINDGTVEVMGVSRDPGVRAKIAVRTHDDKVDPVGACVGLRGNRVKNIIRELSGEKIDIVRWSDDMRAYVTHALAPVQILSITTDPKEPQTLHLKVSPDQFSLLIGRNGQNVKLATRLTGWKLDVTKQEPDASFHQQVADAIAHLADIDGITRQEAETLVANGFLSTDGILAADPAYIQEVTEFDAETANRVFNAASAAQATRKNG